MLILYQDHSNHFHNDTDSRSRSHFFESLVVKLQCSTILSDSTDDVLRSTGWHIGLNLKSDLHLCIEQAGKMLNHGSGYRINVPRQPSRIQCR